MCQLYSDYYTNVFHVRLGRTDSVPFRKNTSRLGKAAHSLRMVSAYSLGTSDASMLTSTTCFHPNA